MANQTKPVQTIEITDFSGRLTRKMNGDMNSGLARFATSFGYDPFSKPQNLTWLENSVDVTQTAFPSVAGTTKAGLPLAAKMRWEAGVSLAYCYIISGDGYIYKVQPNALANANLDSVIGIASVVTNGITYAYGASMEFYGNTEKIYVGGDSQINSINFDGSSETIVGNKQTYTQNVFRPMQKFVGKLFFGNGPTIGALDATNTIISSVFAVPQAGTISSIYSQINPPLDVESNVQDLDVSPDLNYLLITASNLSNTQIATATGDRVNSAGTNSAIFQYNGIDQGVTAGTVIPSYATTALQSYLQTNMFFSQDSFGASIGDGTNKIISLPLNRSPFTHATGVNGNFIFWIAAELNAAANALNASMYYYGGLDSENPPGLYRVLRQSPSSVTGGASVMTIANVPVNVLTNTRYSTINNNASSIVALGSAKHYIGMQTAASTIGNQSGAIQYNNQLFYFLINPSGGGTPQLGIYETQTQMFSKKITVKQTRVYCEPTASGNGFQFDFIGSDGNVITQNSAQGTFTYTFASGTDITKLQGALERIDFNPQMKDTYALGVRITNTGTANMTIHKIEIDYIESGK